jgi:hypothetical protein
MVTYTPPQNSDTLIANGLSMNKNEEVMSKMSSDDIFSEKKIAKGSAWWCPF